MGEQTFSDYLTGLMKLLDQLGKDHPKYFDILGYQAQLIENVENAQKGDTADLRSQRTHIIDRLNRISYAAIGITFLEICFPRNYSGNPKTNIGPDANDIFSEQSTSQAEFPSTKAYKSLITSLENELRNGVQIYPDQCATYINQLRELDETILEYNSSLPPHYENHTSASYLSAKFDRLRELLLELKDAKSPLAITRLRQEIAKVVDNIKISLS